MIDHAHSLQGISVSTRLSCLSIRLQIPFTSDYKLLSGTHAPFVSVTLPPFILHFSVVRFGRRKLAPAALGSCVPRTRASDVLASYALRASLKQQKSKHLFFWR